MRNALDDYYPGLPPLPDNGSDMEYLEAHIERMKIVNERENGLNTTQRAV